MPTMDDWAEFLGKTSVAVKAKKGVEAEYEFTPAKKPVISDHHGDIAIRPPWAWSLMQTKQTGRRRCWWCSTVLSDGECMIHIEGRWDRGVHIRHVTPDAWSYILGQPRGGDARILGQMRSRWTREAKRVVGDAHAPGKRP